MQTDCTLYKLYSLYTVQYPCMHSVHLANKSRFSTVYNVHCTLYCEVDNLYTVRCTNCAVYKYNISLSVYT